MRGVEGSAGATGDDVTYAVPGGLGKGVNVAGKDVGYGILVKRSPSWLFRGVTVASRPATSVAVAGGVDVGRSAVVALGEGMAVAVGVALGVTVGESVRVRVMVTSGEGVAVGIGGTVGVPAGSVAVGSVCVAGRVVGRGRVGKGVGVGREGGIMVMSRPPRTMLTTTSRPTMFRMVWLSFLRRRFTGFSCEAIEVGW
jgi:hypothetical protein